MVIMDLIIAFDDERAGLADVGGKGVNLIRLTRAGFTVPPGCIISTAAYRRFVDETGLHRLVVDEIARLDPQDVAAAETASATIRAAFADRRMPEDLARQIIDGVPALVDGLVDGSVAVRSSATAEDLPDASFAGQQDTFLDVVGMDAVLAAVIACWSSLWTARAISYRAAQRIEHAEASVAVVIQRMVPADVSGVLFTANPLTGVRNRTVVDATTGLGEALVSGQVNPDHFELDSVSGRLVSTSNCTSPVLTRDQLVRLTRLGQLVQAEYGTPQDIEWALVRSRGRSSTGPVAPETIHLLQARAITSLFEVPQAIGGPDGDDQLAVWFSFGAFQGVVGPITPLGRSAVVVIAAGAARLFGARFTPQRLPFVGVAGQRVWLRIDGLLRHPLGRAFVPRMLSIAEPASGAVIAGLSNDSRLAVGGQRIGPVLGVLRFLRRALPRVPQAVRDPQDRRVGLDRAVAAYLDRCAEREARATQSSDPLTRLGRRVAAARSSLDECLRVLLPEFAPIMIPSMVMISRLRGFAARTGDPDADRLVLELLRGLPGNVTTDMDLSLWQVAQSLRSGPEPTADALPHDNPQWREFLLRYGMRGVGEIDLGQPRWRERPAQVLGTLSAYRLIEDPAAAPDAVYASAVAAAEAAADRLAGLAERSGHRELRLVRFMISRLRALMGARETPKFAIIQAMGIIRAGLLASSADLVALGVIDDADDLALLELDDLEQIAAGSRRDWRSVVAARRSAVDAESRRRQVPRVILGDGHAYFSGSPGPGGGADGALSGSPVSPGAVDGLVRVVLDPHASGLRHGEILVCQGTDPAWTPLFLVAAGLVTEVGGMMTHGSVVAREYGIPAVVGVADATARLVTGQRIRLDGTTGTIEILDDGDDRVSSATAGGLTSS